MGYRKIKNLYANKDILMFKQCFASEKVHGCLQKDSLIKMSDGSYKPIKDIQKGEKVFSYDEKKCVFVQREVVDVVIQEATQHLEWYKFELENNMSFICTEDHPILTKKGWVCARDISEKDDILGIKNFMKILNKTLLPDKFVRYDLSIRDTHNFVCAGIVVHNTSTHISYSSERDALSFFSGGCKHEQFVSLFGQEELLEKFRKNAQEYPNTKKITFFGEAYGGKMQGMSSTYGKELKFIVFEVQIDNVWLSVPEADRFATSFGFEFVPYKLINTTEEEINAEMMADSVVAIRRGMGEGHMREGIVLRPVVELVHQNGGRIICKHKRPEFAEREHAPRFADPEKLKILEDANAIAEEWVTMGRLNNAKSHFSPEEWDIKYINKIIKYMVNDVYTEAKGEIVENRDVVKAIGRRTVKLFKESLLNIN